MKRNLAVLVASALFSWGLIGAQGAPRAAPQSKRPGEKARPIFARRWFLGASDREVSGFLNGYYDCLPQPALRKLPGWGISDEAMVAKVYAFYERHRASRLDVGQVALEVAANTPAPPQLAGGEVHRGRRGYYDGLWWLGAGQQVGYVEGYLVCVGHPPTRSETGRLVRAITAWYRSHPPREDSPIADVLEELLQARRKRSAHPRKSGTSTPGS